MTAFITVSVILALLLIIIVLAGAFYAYRKAFYHRNVKGKLEKTYTNAEPYNEIREKLKGWTQALAAVPFEPVSIKSKDGKTLFGRYYHVKDGAPLHIEFHGYKGTAFRDFSGGDPFARKQGFNTLLVDQRAHGDSDGHTITFGILERIDCQLWVEYAVNRFGKDIKIFLSGISMGAATVLMASDLPLPPNVVGIIADSPYSSPKEILQKVCRVDMGLPAKAVYPFLCIGAVLYGHFRVRGGAIESVKRTKIPLLILHGEGDGFVPSDMSRRIAENAASDVTLVTFKDADHCLGYVVSPKEYEEALCAFTEKCLNA